MHKGLQNAALSFLLALLPRLPAVGGRVVKETRRRKHRQNHRGEILPFSLTLFLEYFSFEIIVAVEAWLRAPLKKEPRLASSTLRSKESCHEGLNAWMSEIEFALSSSGRM
jgi:hypothetical protein